MNDHDLDHPTESDLVDLVLGELDEGRSSTVSGHLGSCPACRILFDRARRGLPDLPASGRPPDTAGVVPDVTRRAVRGADRPEAGPRAGELWRARPPGGGPVTLVWVRALDPPGVVAVPVSFDIEFADEYTLVVAEEASPLGLPLALHTSVEATIDPSVLRDRLGSVDVGSDVIEAVLAARRTGEPVRGSGVGPAVVSPLDERIEYRQALADQMAGLAPSGRDDEPADQDEWWAPGTGSDRAGLLMAIHQALGQSHLSARISPRPPTTAAAEHLSAVALVTELDAFVLVASVDRQLEGAEQLEAARRVLHADQLLNAVCLVEPAAPFTSVVIDRRDVVEAIETPSGHLRPARQSRPPAPIGEALTKFLDATISPFGRLASTVVDGRAIDPRQLAVDVSAEAVRTVEASARGYKVQGKRPGYERVTRHRDSIIRLVEEALRRPDIDVASILEDPE